MSSESFTQEHYKEAVELGAEFVANALRQNASCMSFSPVNGALPMLHILGQWRLAIEEMKSEEDLGFSAVTAYFGAISSIDRRKMSADTLYLYFFSEKDMLLGDPIYWMPEEDPYSKRKARLIYIQPVEKTNRPGEIEQYKVEHWSFFGDEPICTSFSFNLRHIPENLKSQLEDFNKLTEKDRQLLAPWIREKLCEASTQQQYCFTTSKDMHDCYACIDDVPTQDKYLASFGTTIEQLKEQKQKHEMTLPYTDWEYCYRYNFERKKVEDVEKFGSDRKGTTLVTPCEAAQYKEYFGIFRTRYGLDITKARVKSPSLEASTEKNWLGNTQFSAQIFGYIAGHKIPLTSYKRIPGQMGLPPDQDMCWCHPEGEEIGFSFFEPGEEIPISETYKKDYLRIQAYIDVLIEELCDTKIDPTKPEDQQILLEKAAVIHWWFSHLTPYQRGSASAGEVIIKGLFKYHGLEITFNPKRIGETLNPHHYMPDCIALTCATPQDFIKEYQIGGKCVHAITVNQSLANEAKEQPIDKDQLWKQLFRNVQSINLSRGKKKEVRKILERDQLFLTKGGEEDQHLQHEEESEEEQCFQYGGEYADEEQPRQHKEEYKEEQYLQYKEEYRAIMKEEGGYARLMAIPASVASTSASNDEKSVPDVCSDEEEAATLVSLPEIRSSASGLSAPGVSGFFPTGADATMSAVGSTSPSTSSTALSIETKATPEEVFSEYVPQQAQ